jgi:membrane peptidoglycan carboxypeptidase
VKGKQVIGIAAASSSYFGVSVGEVSPAELVALVAALRSPNVYGPHVQSERARNRQCTVLAAISGANLVPASEIRRAATTLACDGI